MLLHVKGPLLVAIGCVMWGLFFFTGSLLARKKTQQVWDFLSLTTQLPCSGSHVTKLTNQKPEGLLSFYMYNVIIFLFLFVLFFLSN